MARIINVGRQVAEALVDLLEKHPDEWLHDQSALELAADIRRDFGMCSKVEEDARRYEIENGPKVEIPINCTFFEADFSKIRIIPK